MGQYENAVGLCLKEKRYTDAILIASCFDQNLLTKTRQLYFKSNQTKLSKVMNPVN